MQHVTTHIANPPEVFARQIMKIRIAYVIHEGESHPSSADAILGDGSPLSLNFGMLARHKPIAGDYWVIPQGEEHGHSMSKADFQRQYRETAKAPPSAVDPMGQRPMMCFGRALQRLKLGESVTRVCWNGPGPTNTWVSPGAGLPPCQAAKFNEIMRGRATASPVSPYLIKVQDDVVHVGWIPSHADMMAEDWVTV